VLQQAIQTHSCKVSHYTLWGFTEVTFNLLKFSYCYGVYFMWTGQGTAWYSLCGLDREQCSTVHVDWTGNSVVQCMWTGKGTVWYCVCRLERERCGTGYVDWTGNSVVQCMWTGKGTVWYCVCRLYTERCCRVYVDWTGNSVV